MATPSRHSVAELKALGIKAPLGGEGYHLMKGETYSSGVAVHEVCGCYVSYVEGPITPKIELIFKTQDAVLAMTILRLILTDSYGIDDGWTVSCNGRATSLARFSDYPIPEDEHALLDREFIDALHVEAEQAGRWNKVVINFSLSEWAVGIWEYHRQCILWARVPQHDDSYYFLKEMRRWDRVQAGTEAELTPPS